MTRRSVGSPGPVRIALYDRFDDARPSEPLDLEWSELVALLTHYGPPTCAAATCAGKACRHKTAHASWSPVDIVNWRTNDNVRAITAFVADLDHLTPEGLDAVLASVRAAKLAAIVYSTHSYAPPADGAYRLVVPLSRPCPAADWRRVRRAIVVALVPAADPSCKDLSRLYGRPDSRIGIEPYTLVLDGGAIDLDDALAVAAELPADPKPAAAVPAAATRGTSILHDPARRALGVEVCARHFRAAGRRTGEAGRRHRFALALAGVLYRHSRLDESAAAAFILDVAQVGGSDNSAARAQDARDTYRRIAAGIVATGIPELAKVVGDVAADEIVEAVSDDRAALREFVDAMKAKAAAAPTPPAQISLADLRRRLKEVRRRKLRGAARDVLVQGVLLDRLLDGDPLVTEGDPIVPELDADESIAKVCGVVAFALPPHVPWEAVAEVFRPSLVAMGNGAPQIAAGAFDRARERRLLADAQAAQDRERERERLARDAARMVGR